MGWRVEFILQHVWLIPVRPWSIGYRLTLSKGSAM